MRGLTDISSNFSNAETYCESRRSAWSSSAAHIRFADTLPHDTGEWRRGRGVEALGHAAGEEGFTAGEGGVAHGFGHENGISRFRDGGVHKNAVGADFHGDRCVARSADARIDDHGNFGDAFAQDAQSRGILYAEAGADWRGERHDGGGARVD